MYLKMFGLEEKPFHITPNPRFIFLSKNHKEAFAHLLYGIQQRVGFLSLSGEIGTGKTTVLRTLLGQLEASEYRVALIFNPCLTALELLQTIHREFSIDCTADDNLVALHDSLNRFLLEQRSAGKTVVLVVDEAQNLDPKVLEQLRLLSNLETETEKLIQMVLVGQPELDVLLQREDLRQLRQRLAVSYKLRPMDAEDSESYIRHRLKIAGGRPELFDARALRQVYKLTQGTPRLINILCDRALLVAYSQDASLVTREILMSAQKELSQQSPVASSKPKRLLIALLCTLVVLLAGGKLYQLSSQSSQLLSGQINKKLTVAQGEVTAAQQLQVMTPAAKAMPEPDDARVAEIRQRLADLPGAESGLQTLLAIAERWDRPLPDRLQEISNRSRMIKAFAATGFDLIPLQADTSELARLDVPAVLEIVLPNVAGKRFLAVTGLTGQQVQTVPGLTESGWISFAELETFWFGNCYLPYMNYQRIAYIGSPNAAGRDIRALQQLLTKLQGNNGLKSGVYDRQTIDAVTRFQRQVKLAPDGRVGAQTLFWLYRETGHTMPRLSEERS